MAKFSMDQARAVVEVQQLINDWADELDIHNGLHMPSLVTEDCTYTVGGMPPSRPRGCREILSGAPGTLVCAARRRTDASPRAFQSACQFPQRQRSVHHIHPDLLHDSGNGIREPITLTLRRLPTSAWTADEKTTSTGESQCSTASRASDAFRPDSRPSEHVCSWSSSAGSMRDERCSAAHPVKAANQSLDRKTLRRKPMRFSIASLDIALRAAIKSKPCTVPLVSFENTSTPFASSACA